MKIRKIKKEEKYFHPTLFDVILGIGGLFIITALSSIAGYTTHSLGGLLMFIAGIWLSQLVYWKWSFHKPIVRLPYEIVD